jgi:isopentenyldiphosphate isomerase
VEYFDVLNEDGTVAGRASRTECHTGSMLLHGVVHVLAFTSNNGIILQKRSLWKDIEPDKWDTSVGGHIEEGETIAEALIRESREELGIEGGGFERLYAYIMTSDIEREYVTTFRCTWDVPTVFPPEEISEVRIFTPSEIEPSLGTGFFTPNFEEEWKQYRRWRAVSMGDNKQ